MIATQSLLRAHAPEEDVLERKIRNGNAIAKVENMFAKEKQNLFVDPIYLRHHVWFPALLKSTETSRPLYDTFAEWTSRRLTVFIERISRDEDGLPLGWASDEGIFGEASRVMTVLEIVCRSYTGEQSSFSKLEPLIESLRKMCRETDKIPGLLQRSFEKAICSLA